MLMSVFTVIYYYYVEEKKQQNVIDFINNSIKEKQIKTVSQGTKFKTNVNINNDISDLLQIEAKERSVRLKKIDQLINIVKNNETLIKSKEQNLHLLFNMAPTKEYFSRYSNKRLNKIVIPTVIMDFGGILGDLRGYIQKQTHLQIYFYDLVEKCAHNQEVILSSRALCATIYIEDTKFHHNKVDSNDFGKEIKHLIEFALKK